MLCEYQFWNKQINLTANPCIQTRICKRLRLATRKNFCRWKTVSSTGSFHFNAIPIRAQIFHFLLSDLTEFLQSRLIPSEKNMQRASDSTEEKILVESKSFFCIKQAESISNWLIVLQWTILRYFIAHSVCFSLSLLLAVRLMKIIRGVVLPLLMFAVDSNEFETFCSSCFLLKLLRDASLMEKVSALESQSC